MSKATEALKAKARTQATMTLIRGLCYLEQKESLEEHDRMVRACVCDVIQERESEAFIDTLLECFEQGIVDPKILILK